MAQTQVFRGTARAIRRNPETGTVNYFYHDTPIVGVFTDGSIRLNSGGWQTATTKRAMNQASNQDNLGFQVFQRKHAWFVSWKGLEVPFVDGMFLAA